MSRTLDALNILHNEICASLPKPTDESSIYIKVPPYSTYKGAEEIAIVDKAPVERENTNWKYERDEI